MSDEVEAVGTAAEGGADDGFSPIMSQEDFDKAIKSRLERAERRFREENKEAFEKARAYDERVEQDKTELERATERAERAEGALAEIEKRERIDSWRREVSEETGVPAEVLRGETKDELTGHAEALKAAFKVGRAVIPSDGFAASGKAGKATRDQFAETVTSFLGE